MRSETARGIHAAKRVEGEPDDEFVRRALAGEGQAIEHLLHRHGPRLRRAVGAILRDDDEAQDAMQQTWLHAIGGLRSFAGGSSLATWLTRIAVNEALGRVRARARRPVLLADAPESVDRSAGPEETAAAREAMVRLRGAIGRLSPAALRVFVLRDIEERSVEDTARAMCLTRGAVKARLHRTRRLLRAALEGSAAGAGTPSCEGRT